MKVFVILLISALTFGIYIGVPVDPIIDPVLFLGICGLVTLVYKLLGWLLPRLFKVKEEDQALIDAIMKDYDVYDYHSSPRGAFWKTRRKK